MTNPTDNRAFQIGGTVQPGPSSSTPLLQAVDKSVYYALDYFSWIIRNYPGGGLLLAAISNAGLKDANGKPVTDPVGMAFPDDPVPYLGSTYLRFPCLAVYRKDSKYNKHSAGYYDDRCNFDLVYVLPPMNAGQAEQILPILRAVEQAIRQKTVQSFDPGYTPPDGTLGDSPWGLKYACVEEIGFERGSRGRLPVGNIEFPFLTMSGYVIERDMPLQADNKFAGGDVTANLLAPDGTTIQTFVQVSTQQAPTIASLSPSSGTMAGGVSVTVAGTLFLTGPTVTFGGVPATNVVWNSATSVTCNSPAASGAGTVQVVLTNRDGQTSNVASFAVTSP